MQLTRHSFMQKAIGFSLFAAAALSLSGCKLAETQTDTLYATSVQNAYAILDNADVPDNIIPEAFATAELGKSKDRDPNKAITWQFDKTGFNIFGVRAALTAEGTAATRVTVDVKFLNDPTIASNPEVKPLADLLNNSPYNKEVLRLNFIEFIDAALTGRAYDAQHGGAVFAEEHKIEIAAEMQKIREMPAKRQANAQLEQIRAQEQQSNQPNSANTQAQPATNSPAPSQNTGASAGSTSPPPSIPMPPPEIR